LKLAYVDTSVLVAILFDEPSGAELGARLPTFDRLVSSTLLEAELRSALHREQVGFDLDPLFRTISWIHPDRRLTDEIEKVLGSGYLRGADLWHLATALFVAPDGSEVTFLTLDDRQAHVAALLGFSV
jgi:predicted nucleic acid-binding protein